jgi:hypothetical protein
VRIEGAWKCPRMCPMVGFLASGDISLDSTITLPVVSYVLLYLPDIKFSSIY